MVTSAVVRPVVIGAAATALGCLLSAAPLPAGAAFVGYLGAALLIMLGWVRHQPDHRRFGLAAVSLPALRAPLPFSQLRRVIGLGQAILLVLGVLLAGLLPSVAAGGWLALLPAAGLLSLLWSFGRDAWWQLSARR